MKKLIMTIAIATVMASTPAMAQIFLDDDDVNNRANGSTTMGAIIAEQDVDIDQFEPYVPVGEGIFLLAGLAGAYLVGKRRKGDE